MELLLVIFGTSTIIVILAYGLNSWGKDIPVAVAGNIKIPSKGYDCEYNISVFNIYFHKWKIITPLTHQVVYVGGKSMSRRGLENGDIVFVKKIRRNKEKKIKKGDNILIDVRDLQEKVVNENYKLRCFEGIENKKMEVSTYDKNGDILITDKHSIDKVVGIVEFRLN